MSLKAGAEYAAKDKIATMLTEVFKEAEKEKALIKKENPPVFCLKTIFFATLFITLVSCMTAITTCLVLLR